jgi:2-iminobutanoate/2-iminopropanoate deaminase
VVKQPVGGSRPAGAYSPGIIAQGRFVYVSGQGPLRDGVIVGETAAEQTRITLENLGAVLAAAGASPADVVRCGVFLADMADFAAMNSAYAEFFPEPLPARTTVGVGLAGFKVEIDCVAVLPEQDER